MTEWLDEQRRFNGYAKRVLADAEVECVRRALNGNDDKVVSWLLLATVAADADARKPLVRVIRAGLAAMTEAWAEVAEEVALGRMTDNEANDQMATKVHDALREAIKHADWPGILNADEIRSLSTLMEWLDAGPS